MGRVLGCVHAEGTRVSLCIFADLAGSATTYFMLMSCFIVFASRGDPGWGGGLLCAGADLVPSCICIRLCHVFMRQTSGTRFTKYLKPKIFLSSIHTVWKILG